MSPAKRLPPVTRRAALLAVAAGALPVRGARAQGTARPMTAVGVYALLGDSIAITVIDPPTDTLIDRGTRESVDVKSIGFDHIVLREVRTAFGGAAPAAKLHFFRAATLQPAEQRRIVEDARGGALPAWMVEAVRTHRLSHLLLVTRQRAEAALRTDENVTIGRGRVDGLGFYMDRNVDVRNTVTGATAQGAIGPHIVVQLSLFDTESAQVERSYTVNEQWLVAPRESQSGTDPWQYMTPAEKVEALRGGLERSLQRVLPAFLKGS